MSKWVLIAIVVLGALGTGFYFTQQPKSQDDIRTKGNAVVDIDDSMVSDHRYIEYSKKAFDNAVDKRRVLFFYANWCPTCRPTDANLKENINRIPEDVLVIRVNYNDTETDEDEKGLAQKYAVTYQHTFVQIDAQGNKISAWNGGQIGELLSNLK